MKKTLLAAALLTGYAGAAMAQNSVTLYGVVDVGLQYLSVKPGAALPGTDTKSQFGMASGGQQGSRWGIRGVEDLGNGLQANFVYEQGIAANTGATQGAGFQRQSTIGLVSDSWGGVDLGRRTAPSTAALSGIDPMGVSYGTSGLQTSIGQSFYRLSNMVMYSSPSISGFRAFAGYSFDTGLDIKGTPTNATTVAAFGSGYKSRGQSVGLRYANGPIVLAATFDNIQAPSSRTAVEASKNFKTWAIGGTYDLKVVKIHGAYSQAVDGLLNNRTTINSAVEGTGDTNQGGELTFLSGSRTQSWMVGLSAPLGNGSVFASVQQKLPGGNLKELATANELAASIGYSYNLSNRTAVYAFYSYVDNIAMVKNATSNNAGVGIRHSF